MAKITSKKIDYKYIESLVGKVIKNLNQFELKYYTNNFEHLTNTNEDLLSTLGIVGKTCIYDPKEKDIIRPEVIIDVYHNYVAGREVYYLREPLSDSLLPYNEFFESLSELSSRLSTLYTNRINYYIDNRKEINKFISVKREDYCG